MEDYENNGEKIKNNIVKKLDVMFTYLQSFISYLKDLLSLFRKKININKFNNLTNRTFITDYPFNYKEINVRLTESLNLQNLDSIYQKLLENNKIEKTTTTPTNTN